MMTKKFSQFSSISIGKKNDLNYQSDDAILFIQNRIYGVFDGVSSRGRHVDGAVHAGGGAARTCVKSALSYVINNEQINFDSCEFINQLSADLKEEYNREGVCESRFATTASLALEGRDKLLFLIVGDSGVRINGVETIQFKKPIDDIFSMARSVLLSKRVPSNCNPSDFYYYELLVREMLFNGIESSVHIEDVMHVISREMIFPCGFNNWDDIYNLLRNGISNYQHLFANRVGHYLGYAVLNGGSLHGRDYFTFVRDLDSVNSMEFFTDGYMTCGDDVSIQSWERSWNNVEKIDPYKLGKYKNIKCSIPGELWDDRSLLIIS